MRTFFVPVALVTLAGLALAVAGGLRDPRRTRVFVAEGLYAAVMVVTLGFLLLAAGAATALGAAARPPRRPAPTREGGAP